MDPNVCFTEIVDAIMQWHALHLRGQLPSLDERRRQRERFDSLSAWTDGGGFHPAPIIAHAQRWTWNPYDHCVETFPA